MPIAQIDRDGAVTWFHTDQSGNIRALSDATGRLVATFDWDAYGLPTSTTGTATSRLGFQGGWTDPGTGLQYRMARVYDPATGQFLSIDPLVVRTRQPYAFAAGDPLAFGDPMGTDPVPLSGATGAGATTRAWAAAGAWAGAADAYTATERNARGMEAFYLRTELATLELIVEIERTVPGASDVRLPGFLMPATGTDGPPQPTTCLEPWRPGASYFGTEANTWAFAGSYEGFATFEADVSAEYERIYGPLQRAMDAGMQRVFASPEFQAARAAWPVEWQDLRAPGAPHP
jgi:RHS repeat-associated protein